MAINMDTTFTSTNFQENAPLSKRRRFVPVSDFPFALGNEHSSSENQASDSPLMLQLSGKMPTPQEIEAELLQVGMRIRKSVGDGHQTASKKFTPRPFFNMHRLSPATQAALTSGALDVQPISTATFCGVNLAALAHISTTPVEQQKMWTYTTSHKRGYEGESDSDDQEFMPRTPTLDANQDMTAIPVDYFNIDMEQFGEVSPMTQVREPIAAFTRGRKVAKPKSRKQQPPVQQICASNPFAQIQLPPQPTNSPWMGHRRMTSCGIEANMSFNDLTDAPFLQRRDDVDMGCS